MERSGLFSSIAGIDAVFCNRFDSKDLMGPLLLNQIHSTRVVVFNNAGQDIPPADAWVTRQTNAKLTLKTADCAPVLFVDETARVIGAAHAGWRGALTGVLESTLLTMVGQGANLRRIKVAVGPCIHVNSCPVQADMERLFSKDMAPFFPAYPDGQNHFDMVGYIRCRLHRAGILPEHVDVIDVDTFTDLNYNSFRRDAERSERQYSAIWLKSSF